MAPLGRTLSSSTATTTDPSLSPSPATGDRAHRQVPYVPYIRRRNTPAQLRALEHVFKATEHPSREQRQNLADELGLQLKSVTNWFQNRRQTARRKSLTHKENIPSTQSPPARHPPKVTVRSSLSSTVSLDRIAALSERPTPSRSAATRVPFSPCSTIIQNEPVTPRGSAELWKHMPSSPLLAQSSPCLEEARLAHLPSEAKTFRSLEWACLKARRENTIEDERRSSPDADAETGREFVGVAASHRLGTASSLPTKGSVVGLKPDARSEDVEAAVTLLGIKTRS